MWFRFLFFVLLFAAAVGAIYKLIAFLSSHHARYKKAQADKWKKDKDDEADRKIRKLKRK